MIDLEPLVSVGLPVFNGENYLSECIESVLNQTYHNFELVISDNSSTDRTRQICEHYLALDKRVKYHRNRENLGAAKNFNLVYWRAQGKYFKWAAHDDVLGREYLALCVAALERDADAVLAHSRASLIDDHGRVIARVPASARYGAEAGLARRFGKVIRHDRVCDDVFGVMRTDALRHTDLIASHIGSDRTLRAQLCLLGKFIELPQYEFCLRDHEQRSIRAMPAHHQRATWFDPAKRSRRLFPHWRIFAEYGKAAMQARMSWRQKMACCWHVCLWLAIDMNWARLLADVFIAFFPGSWRFFFWVTNLARIGNDQQPKSDSSIVNTRFTGEME